MKVPRALLFLTFAALAALLTPGCLNFVVPEEQAPPPGTFLIHVTALPEAPSDQFPMNRTDLEDLLVANASTTDLNGLVTLLNEAAAGIRPKSFIRVKENSWGAALDRFGDLCSRRGTRCNEGIFHVGWNGDPIEVRFERTLG